MKEQIIAVINDWMPLLIAAITSIGSVITFIKKIKPIIDSSDIAAKESKKTSKAVISSNARYQHIDERLDRIEAKIDRVESKQKGVKNNEVRKN